MLTENCGKRDVGANSLYRLEIRGAEPAGLDLDENLAYARPAAIFLLTLIVARLLSFGLDGPAQPLALFLAIFFPGLGHIYAASYERALMIIGGIAVSVWAMVHSEGRLWPLAFAIAFGSYTRTCAPCSCS